MASGNSNISFQSQCDSLEMCLERYDTGEESYPVEFFFQRFESLAQALDRLPKPEREESLEAYEVVGFEIYQVLKRLGYQDEFPPAIKSIVGISGVYEYPKE